MLLRLVAQTLCFYQVLANTTQWHKDPTPTVLITQKEPCLHTYSVVSIKRVKISNKLILKANNFKLKVKL